MYRIKMIYIFLIRIINGNVTKSKGYVSYAENKENAFRIIKKFSGIFRLVSCIAVV